MKVTFLCVLYSLSLLRTTSEICGSETAQWHGEEIGSFTARPEEREDLRKARAGMRSSKVTQMPWAGAFIIIMRLSEGNE